jgi:predicted dehydrogenase
MAGWLPSPLESRAMNGHKRVNVAVVGLGFGAEFIPIYQRHPSANMYAICQRTKSKLDEIGDRFGVAKRYSDFDELLRDPAVDAVHINTPIPEHGPQSIRALRAGKHVACTVPMATSVEECQQIVHLSRETGRKYMMMETVVFSREFLFVKELYERGELGRLQFVQASHQQDMAGWPGYWEGLPPMHYATHCVGPCLALAGTKAESVSCYGSGRIDEALIGRYGSPFAIESCHIKLKGSDLLARVHRSLFATARQYRESFDVYGSLRSFEWPLVEGERPIVHTRGRPEPEIPERVDVPDYAHRLPEPIRAFTRAGVYDADDNQHLSFTQGAGHGGSHPHLVHEFLSALVEDRPPMPDAATSANWTCTGILAHQSALAGGERIPLPAFTF